MKSENCSIETGKSGCAGKSEPTSKTFIPKCRGCGSPKGFPVMSVKPRFAGLDVRNYQILRCYHCGLIYAFPDPTEADINLIYSGADYMGDIFDNPKGRKCVVRKNWSPVLMAIEHNIPKGLILDVGCSDGLFMDIAKSRGWQVFGIDINSEKLCIARHNHGDHVQLSSIYAMDWPANHFDAVRMCHVLEHLTDPGKALWRLQSVLRPGGLLNIGVPVLDDRIFYWLRQVPPLRLRNKLIKILGWIDPPHHLTTWSTQSLETTLKSHGFEIIWKSYRSDVIPWIKGFRKPCLFFKVIGIPLGILGSGATVKVLARKTK